MRIKNSAKIVTCFLIIFLGNVSMGQETTQRKLPTCKLKDLQGKTVDTEDISNNGKPILICFWKSCCKPPVTMLDEIADLYEDWTDETGVILYAISIDDSRSSSRVAPFVNSKDWDFEVLLDPNSEFKRAMSVVLTPHIFLLNGDGLIVWQKATYAMGDEEIIFKEIKKIVKEE